MGQRRSAAWRHAVLFFMTPLFWAAIAFAETIHVPDDHPTIQAAIDAAKEGDKVLVAPGEYFENIDLLGKSITLRSEAGPKETIIDGQDTFTAIVCVSGEGKDTVIEGFTVRNSWSRLNAPSISGMHIVESSPTVIDCHFIRSESSLWTGLGTRIEGGSPTFLDSSFKQFLHGNGMSVGDADVLVVNCTFVGNGTGTNGTGLFASHSTVVILGSTFTHNGGHAGTGGAVSANGSTVEIVDSTFMNNSFDDTYGGAVGAIAHGNASPSTITIINCYFQSNSTKFGGAVANVQTIIGSTFVDNFAHTAAAAFNVETVIDSTFIGNSAYDGSTVLVNNGLIDGCVFMDNSTGFGPSAVWVGGTSTIRDSTFMNNVNAHPDYFGAIDVVEDGHVEFSGNEFCGNGQLSISGDWINLGGNTFSPHCPVGDLNGDGAVDVFDLLTLLGAWGLCKDTVDCPADLNGDGVVNVFDLLILLANWG